MAMDARDLALGGDSPRSWQPGPEGQTWWELLLVPGGSGGYHVGRVGLQWWLHPLHVMSLNSGALLLWQSGYLPQAFLLQVSRYPGLKIISFVFRKSYL